MPGPITFVIAVAAVFAVIVLARQVRAWRKYRGGAVVTCPEDQKPAGVTLDARHAAITGRVGAPELRLSACARWPERGDCGAPCLSQIATSPNDCLIRYALERWYEGKTCVYCGQPFSAIEWTSAKPALLQRGEVSVDWNQVPAEKLHETLSEAQPVCFACHTAGTMVRQHPDMVVDRGK